MGLRRASVVLELHSADQIVQELVDEELDRRGLRPNLFAILSLIYLHEPVTPTELSVESGVRPTTLRDLVNEMIERGHVRRLENPDDRRSHFLEVTAEGHRFMRKAWPAVQAVERRIEEELGAPLETLREPLADLRRAARGALKHDEISRIRGS